MTPSEIALRLPVVFQRAAAAGGPLAALIDVMAEMHAPAEGALDELSLHLDPWRTPERFIPMLARWMHLDLGLAVDRMQQRALVASAVRLWKKRGTVRGLEAFLEIATGTSGFRIEDRERPFHLRVIAPAILRPHEARLRRIIDTVKPAAVTSELVIADEN